MPKIILASGPVIIEDDKVLLDKHGLDPFWKFCGGRFDDLEQSLIEHAQNRAFLELGIEVEIINRKPFVMWTQKEAAPDGKIDVVLFHFLARHEGEISPGEDIRDWKWIPISELDELEKKGELAPNIIPTLKHFRII
ncbi:MAG TPA: NUDIX hydrolase [Patescibacteria group bacterium]